MAITKEIWVNSIVEGLFADNTFASRSIDHSGYVNNRTVHVPNAGAAPNIVKGRTTFPATVTTREDVDLNYNIGEFTTDPIRIPHAEQVELSYNKRESVLYNSRLALADAAHNDLAYSWAEGTTNKVKTTGDSVPVHIPGATGTRYAFTHRDVLNVKRQFDADDIPAEGRCILLDSVMYDQLLTNMSNEQVFLFASGSDTENGIVGRFMGFDFYMRSKVLKVNASGTLKQWSASTAATDSAAGLAWHTGCVSRALGEVNVFENNTDPLYYGDVISFLVRCGGKYMRNDKKGVVLICQGNE